MQIGKSNEIYSQKCNQLRLDNPYDVGDLVLLSISHPNWLHHFMDQLKHTFSWTSNSVVEGSPQTIS
ncbi:hypothetical protein PR048_027952 [Dryococelus australis]|uniref:Uncharacterized protein n=1 Tax=Dryococelus australis TaxID=614101 RepID=A0ABQ9GHY2_9NEOP|nr:hypothetical protein PR048_027952 [Dryococelus australis]